MNNDFFSRCIMISFLQSTTCTLAPTTSLLCLNMTSNSTLLNIYRDWNQKILVSTSFRNGNIAVQAHLDWRRYRRWGNRSNAFHRRPTWRLPLRALTPPEVGGNYELRTCPRARSRQQSWRWHRRPPELLPRRRKWRRCCRKSAERSAPTKKPFAKTATNYSEFSSLFFFIFFCAQTPLAGKGRDNKRDAWLFVLNTNI